MAVHEGWSYTTEAQLKQWLSGMGATFSAVLDNQPMPIGALYGVTGVPHVFIIGPDMKIAKIIYGYSNCDEIRDGLQEVIDSYAASIFKFIDPKKYRFGPVDVPRWMKVAYLIINLQAKDIFGSIEARPSKRFNAMVKGYLDAYLIRRKMPPADIAAAIFNLADDYGAGKVMNLRAGDYLALQNHMRDRGRAKKRSARASVK